MHSPLVLPGLEVNLLRASRLANADHVLCQCSVVLLFQLHLLGTCVVLILPKPIKSKRQ